MRIAIVGSRDYPNEEQVRSFVRTLPRDWIIVSGGARGVDKWAEDEAKKLGMGTDIYLPDWDIYGKGAGMLRNSIVVANSDMVVAFTIGTGGTNDTITK